MAAKVNHQLTISVTFTINEVEARALDALAGYGDDAFMDMFYKQLGKHYMQPNEAGMRSFLKTIREVVSGPIHEVERARRMLAEGKKEVLDG